ncbi:MAG: hypothetical protein Q8R45_09330 [Brevundimonas sp.]|uniref:hypothetical protein n=1 Tax=Brevundimonas sp. TaxID=1871086 RepID=UPI002734DAC9|nr:hypothetical protein [Brevundimonas sp.]MDP3657151.1 hypothetical protein [Brevundimonas sp.]MDZ4109667.1 hypothetical protein [Brevundimonas sp.]
MADEVRPVEPIQRRAERRAADRRAEERRAGSASRALVPVDFPAEPAEPPARPAPTPPADPGAAVFAAQMMGQTGQRRGLKGGPPVLDAARSAYLGTEHSGVGERRPQPGRAKDTDV